MDFLRRLEVWDEPECAAGSQLGFIPDWADAEDERVLDGLETTTVTVPQEAQVAQDGTDLVQHGRVLRAVFNDGDLFERRIRKINRTRESEGQRVVEVTGKGIGEDLSADLVKFHHTGQANGATDLHFERYGLTVTDHLNSFIMPAAPSYFAVGTIEASGRVDMIYDWMTPLQAIRELAKQATGPNTDEPLEVQFRRNGATDYRIDLLETIGSGGDTPAVRVRRNLQSASIQEDSREAATRVYPRGAARGGVKPDMGRAEWEVANFTILTTGGEPVVPQDVEIVFEGEPMSDLDGFDQVPRWLWILGGGASGDSGTHYSEDEWLSDTWVKQITDITPPDTLEVAFGETLDFVDEFHRARFCLNGDGDELTFLRDYTDEQNNPVRAMVVDRPDLPTVINRVRNPFLNNWTSGSPDDWLTVGTPTTVEESTNSEFWKAGGSSAHIVTDAADEGIRTRAIPVLPTTDRPNLAAQIRLWVVSGTVRLRIVDSTNDVLYPPAGNPATTQIEGGWTEVLGVSPGKVNFAERATESMILVVESHGGPAEFYLDAAMLMPRSGRAESYVDGGYARELWLAAQRALVNEREPRKQYNVEFVDLGRIDSDQYPSDQVLLGSDIVVEDPDAGISIQERITSVTRNLDEEGDTQVGLQKIGGQDRRPRSFTGAVGQSQRPNQRDVTSGEGVVSEEGVQVIATTTDPGEGSSSRENGTLIAVYSTS